MWAERVDKIIELNDLFHLIQACAEETQDEGIYTAIKAKIATVYAEFLNLNGE